MKFGVKEKSLKIIIIQQMNRDNIIILTDGASYETWGALTEICEKHGFSYNYLKRKKFPFTYRGLEFIKVPFRKLNGVSDSTR